MQLKRSGCASSACPQSLVLVQLAFQETCLTEYTGIRRDPHGSLIWEEGQDSSQYRCVWKTGHGVSSPCALSPPILILQPLTPHRWETGYTALFLMSNEAAYTNGTTNVMDGGIWAGIAGKARDPRVISKM